MLKIVETMILFILLTTPVLSAPIHQRRNQNNGDRPHPDSARIDTDLPVLQSSRQESISRSRDYADYLSVREPISRLEWFNTAMGVVGTVGSLSLGGFNTKLGYDRWGKGLKQADQAQKKSDLNHAQVLSAVKDSCPPKPAETKIQTVTVTVTPSCHSATGTATPGKPGDPPPTYPEKNHISRHTLEVMHDVGKGMVKVPKEKGKH